MKLDGPASATQRLREKVLPPSRETAYTMWSLSLQTACTAPSGVTTPLKPCTVPASSRGMPGRSLNRKGVDQVSPPSTERENRISESVVRSCVHPTYKFPA